MYEDASLAELMMLGNGERVNRGSGYKGVEAGADVGEWRGKGGASHSFL